MKKYLSFISCFTRRPLWQHQQQELQTKADKWMTRSKEGKEEVGMWSMWQLSTECRKLSRGDQWSFASLLWRGLTVSHSLLKPGCRLLSPTLVCIIGPLGAVKNNVTFDLCRLLIWLIQGKYWESLMIYFCSSMRAKLVWNSFNIKADISIQMPTFGVSERL